MMKKFMPVLVFLFVLFTVTGIVSASSVNSTGDYAIVDTDTQLSDSTSITDNVDESSASSDCCSVIIQGDTTSNSSSSTISYRHDSASESTINISSDSGILEQNLGSNASLQVLISGDGWLVGNGGNDNSSNTVLLREYALDMINNNRIDNETFNSVCLIKNNTSSGHFVIKAPNGEYALYIRGNSSEYVETGILSLSEFLCVPNNPAYFVSGRYQNYTNTSSFITSSRLIAAMDASRSDRRVITTYYYAQSLNTSSVRVYVYNDDGRYAGMSTASLTDNIRTNNRYISASTMRSNYTIGNSPIERYNYSFKVKTIVSSPDITIHNDSVSLSAFVTDEYGNNISIGFVSLLVDGRTVKYENGSVVYADVINGTATINHTIPDIFQRKNHTYYFRYYGKGIYNSSLGSNGTIFVGDLLKLDVTHSNTTIFGTNLTITSTISNINDEDNGTVDFGQVIFKVNGKTIRDDLNNTVVIRVENGTVVFDLDLDYRYSAKVYNVTVVYGYKNQRIESNTSVSISKIPTSIMSPVAVYDNSSVFVNATLVDMNSQPVEYYSYVSVKIDGITLRDADNRTITFNITEGVMNFTFDLPYNLSSANHTLMLVVPELRETLGVRENVSMIPVESVSDYMGNDTDSEIIDDTSITDDTISTDTNSTEIDSTEADINSTTNSTMDSGISTEE